MLLFSVGTASLHAWDAPNFLADFWPSHRNTIVLHWVLVNWTLLHAAKLVCCWLASTRTPSTKNERLSSTKTGPFKRTVPEANWLVAAVILQVRTFGIKKWIFFKFEIFLFLTQPSVKRWKWSHSALPINWLSYGILSFRPFLTSHSAIKWNHFTLFCYPLVLRRTPFPDFYFFRSAQPILSYFVFWHHNWLHYCPFSFVYLIFDVSLSVLDILLEISFLFFFFFFIDRIGQICFFCSVAECACFNSIGSSIYSFKCIYS